VQGVGYRATTAQQARRLALAGWVRNLPDGSVEVMAEGGDLAVLGFLEYLRRGPGGARVTNVETDWAEATGDFSGFEIR
ncbi:MAG TPA: acylphosphatase, partial [Polyangia bacterium]|nr:acylphosphatase [Polyangia bacterium]